MGPLRLSDGMYVYPWGHWEWFKLLYNLSSSQYCGITLATGSYSTTTNWYSLDGELSLPSIINSIPIVTYYSASELSPSHSLSIKRSFILQQYISDEYNITHIGLSDRYTTWPTNQYILWSKDKLKTPIKISATQGKTFEILISFDSNILAPIPVMLARSALVPSGTLQLTDTWGITHVGNDLPSYINARSQYDANIRFGTNNSPN